MVLALFFAFIALFALVLGLMPVGLDSRPKLQLNIEDPLAGLSMPNAETKKKGPLDPLFIVIRKISAINRPISISPIGQRVYRDLGMAKAGITVDEFFLIKELLMVFCAFVVFKFNSNSDFFMFMILISFAVGYMLPEFWIKARIKKVRVRSRYCKKEKYGQTCHDNGLDFSLDGQCLKIFFYLLSLAGAVDNTGENNR